ENGNFMASAQALKDFIAKVEPERIISQDYLYLGKALMEDTTKLDEAMVNISKAVDMDSTNAAIMSDIGKNFYDAKQYDDAAKAYEISIKNPERSIMDYWYLGSSYYFDYAAKNNAGLEPPKDLLVQADSAFSYLVQRSPTTHAAWQFRARINRLLDGAEDEQDRKSTRLNSSHVKISY